MMMALRGSCSCVASSSRALLPSLAAPVAVTSPRRPIASSSSSRLPPSLATTTTSRSVQSSGRQFHTSSRRHRFRFLISHSFQGKPPDPDPSQQAALDEKGKPLPEHLQPSKPPPKAPKQIGWPSNTEIGKWRDGLLGGGEAGEDSLMVATQGGEQADGDVAIGVADGVGSWSQNGVDPALFSQALMYHASTAFEAASSATSPEADPVQLIDTAYRKVLKESGVAAGSSTAVVLTLEAATGYLRSANLGDSGFMVLREEEQVGEEAFKAASPGQDVGRGKGTPGKRPMPGTLYRSNPQQYYFNAPYQLSKIPKKILDQWTRENGGQSPSLECEPSSANRWECQLKHGDLIIVASDGAFDNVWGKEWVALVRFLREKHRESFASHHPDAQSPDVKKTGQEPWEEEKTLVEVIAYNALQYTLMCQFSEKKRSPFEAEAEKSRIRYPGGKVDDVAIVVAMVVEEP